MIGTDQEGNVVFAQAMAAECAEIIGEYRVQMIDKLLSNSLQLQINASFLAASTGAMRWPIQFRPEVLIDLSGRLV